MDIGLCLRTNDQAHLGRPYSWAETRALALRAEDGGFESLWLYDHLLYREPGEPAQGIWECWTFLSALAEVTQRVQLGTLVSCVLFRNPALLAKMAVGVDEVSGGRVILGLGAGWNAPEFEAFGIPFDHRTSRFEEALHIIHPLLTKGQVDFEGTYYTARNGELAPRGPRPHGPPLLLGTWGPRGLRLTAEYASMWNAGYLSHDASLEEAIATVDAACRAVGRDPATLAKTSLIAVTFPDLGGPAIQREEESIQLNAAQTVKFQMLAGTPASLAERFLGYERLGLAHVMLEVHPFTREAIDRVAEARCLYRERSASV